MTKQQLALALHNVLTKIPPESPDEVYKEYFAQYVLDPNYLEEIAQELLKSQIFAHKKYHKYA